MKECPICHTKNSSDNQHCISCGLELKNISDNNIDTTIKKSNDSIKHKNSSKTIFIIIVFSLIFIAVLTMIFVSSLKTDDTETTETFSESIQTKYEYDALQQIFLEADDIITPEHLIEYTQPYIEKYNLIIKSKTFPKLGNAIEYKLAYSEDVAELKYPERGDYVLFTFYKNEQHNNYFLSNVQYFNNTAYNSEDICIAEYDGIYSGHYSYKYKENLNKSNLIFDDAETLINQIIDNANTVYITHFGKKYHFSKSCAGKNATEKNLSEIKNTYTPCKQCSQ